MSSIPAKPAGSRWTEDQWKAIAIRDRNVLVAAAAGSGKTAVLIERILRMITSEENPVDVDRLLVATFTKAAADEMRERMRTALEKHLATGAASHHVRRQLALMQRASITTLHAFCMEVIRKYYYLIPLDPGFRIANVIESELLRQDVIEALFERYYSESEPDSPFWGLLDRFGGERSDDALFELVLRLFDFSRSHPFPAVWLKEAVQQFADFRADADNPLLNQMLQEASMALKAAAGWLSEGKEIACSPGGPYVYADSLQEELAMINGLQQVVAAGSWNEVCAQFSAAAFGKLKPARGDELDKQLLERAKGLRDKAKKQVQELRSQLFGRTAEQLAEEMHQLHPYMDMLVELVMAFDAQYAEAKAEKRLVDFSDLEHYALQVLCEGIGKDGALIPSQAAKEYQAHYIEILIDEYQDTNQVQEAILSLIARPGAGNRFMVGDVKQSIYRFRLADPGIFLSKYRAYQPVNEGQQEEGSLGTAIDLSRNFRSRSQVVDGVNYIFRQVMEEESAEINYDERAELVYGAGYPESPDGPEAACMELYLVHRQSEASPAGGETEEETTSSEESVYELETTELEARLTALKIKELIGADGHSPYQVYDRDQDAFRNATYRDIVILLRATEAAAPVYVEKLQEAGIPAYAELSTGYFEATEVDVMLSVLKIIDNPLQDIPLAGVLRSPIVGLTSEQLASIRLIDPSMPFYACVIAYQDKPEAEVDVKTRDQLRSFFASLQEWQREARDGALSDLIWRIYRETGYYDYVGGLPGGEQRQANLKALYDRARQFETTSLRGLFRFLRFIKRMQESGSDLGAAKALSEQEDVVRIMSIHKSKGLEFPIVIAAGMAKQFNQRDLAGNFLMHKELGFGPMITDPALGIRYPSAANMAMKRRMRMEMLAEEMRILYVALTRAKEKLILLGTTRNIEQQLERWSAALRVTGSTLPAYLITAGRSFLDWIGLVILRHPSMRELRSAWKLGDPEQPIIDPSQFRFQIISQDRLIAWQEAAAARQVLDQERMALIARAQPVPVRPRTDIILPDAVNEQTKQLRDSVISRLEWRYPYEDAQTYYSKTSVTELKRMRELELLAEEDAPIAHTAHATPTAIYRRPRFMAEKRMSAAERGTLYHAIMQHLPLQPGLSEEHIHTTMQRMVELELLHEAHLKEVDVQQIAKFFGTDIGRRLIRSPNVRKELPFSYGLPAAELHPEASGQIAAETVLIQGVIDCLFEEDDGFVLLDYKTDRVIGSPEQVAAKYSVQLELYARAISAILRRKVTQKALYFFDGGHLVIL